MNIPEFHEYDVVELIIPCSDKTIPLGSRGTVLIVYKANPPVYEVEFMDSDNNTLGLLTISGDALRKVASSGDLYK